MSCNSGANGLECFIAKPSQNIFRCFSLRWKVRPTYSKRHVRLTRDFSLKHNKKLANIHPPKLLQFFGRCKTIFIVEFFFQPTTGRVVEKVQHFPKIWIDGFELVSHSPVHKRCDVLFCDPFPWAVQQKWAITQVMDIGVPGTSNSNSIVVTSGILQYRCALMRACCDTGTLTM